MKPTKSDPKIKSDLPDIIKKDTTEVLSLDDISEEAARDMVYKGSLSMQYLLFQHAYTQVPRVNRLGNLIGKIEDELFSDKTLEELDKGQLVKLYGLATHQMTDSISFLERLHSMVQETGDVVKVTKSMSYEVEGSSTSLESVKYKVKNNDRLRNIKDILVGNILGDSPEEIEEVEE